MPVVDERAPTHQSRIPPSKDSSRIAGMFDAIASRYDFLNHLLSGGLDKRWRKRAIVALHLTGHEIVVDLCTGTADLALAATGATPHARRVVGIDFSAAMLAIGRTKIVPSIDLIRADATVVPLRDTSVHAVTIGFGIRNVENADQASWEILRVLRPGGRLVILEFWLPRSAILKNLYLLYFREVLPRVGRLVSRHPSAYTYLPQSVEAFPSPEQFCDQLRAAGFGTVRAVPLTLGVVYLFVAVKDAP
jgi:demethylmenaquinone methyltransferase/2-methoxy-6-polyprenyl-1,4-benzoquinol methylase